MNLVNENITSKNITFVARIKCDWRVWSIYGEMCTDMQTNTNKTTQNILTLMIT